MEIREQVMDTGRCRMAWLEAGAGWPVILLHAFPLTAEMWRPQLERVPAGSRFIAPHLRGFGGSVFLPPEGGSPMSSSDSRRPPSGGSELTIDDYADDVAALMDCLEIESATIGGLSMGGYVTLALHRRSAERFTAMILADTKSEPDTAEGREGRIRMRALLAAGGARAVADQMLPTLVAESSRADTPDAGTQVRTMIEGSSPDAIDAAIGALMGRPDATPGLARISCGTLVVVGEHDEVTPVADAESLHRAIPRSTLAVIPRAGHLSSIEQPAAFSKVLDDFLLSHL
jgi:pimeloyl-ACP methyl ester carboxylesterase